MRFIVRTPQTPEGEGEVVEVMAEDRASALDLLIDEHDAVEYEDLYDCAEG